MRLRLRRAGLSFNDRLFGIYDSGHLDATKLTAIIENLPPGISEIHLHPATAALEDPATAGWQPQAGTGRPARSAGAGGVAPGGNRPPWQ